MPAGDWAENAFGRTIFVDDDFLMRRSRCEAVTAVRPWRSQDSQGEASGAEVERAGDPQRERLVAGRYGG